MGTYTIKLLSTENSVYTGNICSYIQGAWTERTLNVRTSISLYGPHTWLIRAYFLKFIFQQTERFQEKNVHRNQVEYYLSDYSINILLDFGVQLEIVAVQIKNVLEPNNLMLFKFILGG